MPHAAPPRGHHGFASPRSSPNALTAMAASDRSTECERWAQKNGACAGDRMGVAGQRGRLQTATPCVPARSGDHEQASAPIREGRKMADRKMGEPIFLPGYFCLPFVCGVSAGRREVRTTHTASRGMKIQKPNHSAQRTRPCATHLPQGHALTLPGRWPWRSTQDSI